MCGFLMFVCFVNLSRPQCSDIYLNIILDIFCEGVLDKFYIKIDRLGKIGRLLYIIWAYSNLLQV